MKPETKRLKVLLAELGIPRGENTVAAMGTVSAAVHTQSGRKIVDDNAEHIAARGYRVYIKTYPCGCYATARLTWVVEGADVHRSTVDSFVHECAMEVVR